MIKTVFFDFGRTLVEHPEDGAGEAVVRRFGITDGEDVKLVRDALFSLKGAMKSLDDASISREEYSAQVLASVPKRLWEATEKAMEYPIEWLPDIEGMEKLLCDLKKDGYKLYIASNMDLLHASQMRSHRLAHYFDGMVFSSEIRVGKPLRAYYEKLVSICEAIPEESVFVDDLEANVTAAEEIGMQGFVFKGDAEALRSFIYGRV